MYGTGFLPTEEVNLYRVERDELYLTGTSEVALAAMHGGEVLDADSLPLRYAGYSTCFRREAGAAGKDTRGMFRVHQFDKVEMFVFCRPEDSPEEHDRLLATEEALVGELGLPYRVVNIAAGDLGASAVEEVRHRGAGSPARAATARSRRPRTRPTTSRAGSTSASAGEAGLEFVHTLNGTAVTARAMIAILENFQDEGGAVVGAGGSGRIRRAEPHRARRLEHLRVMLPRALLGGALD